MDFTSFSHGQVLSKLWLCEQLETFAPDHASVAILGSWHNVMGLLMVTRRPTAYSYILGIDSDAIVVPIADKICDAYRKDFSGPIENICGDANDADLSKFDIVINCSVEHMDSTAWFDSLLEDTIVCIQSSNMNTANQHWNILIPCESIEELSERFPMKRVLFTGEKKIGYDTWGYSRFMLIGTK